MRKRLSLVNEENELINLTPLLDVLFVVLILFILIAPMMNIDKINLTQSSSKTLETSSMNEKNTLPIMLSKSGQIFVANKLASVKTLKAVLYKIHETNKSIKPRLFVDANAPFGKYTEIKDLIEETGFSCLEIALKPTDSK